MKPDDEEKWLCDECVGEAFLKTRIEREGQTKECSFCGRQRKAMPLDAIADAFEAAFEQHLYRTAEQPSDFEYLLMKESNYDWERSGDPVSLVLQELGEVEEDVAEAIRRVLNDRHSDYESYQMHEECDFDDDSHYGYSAVNTEEFSAAWRAFTDDLKTRSRYFSRTAEATLTDLFDSIHEYKTSDGRKIILEAGPETDFRSLFRARVFQSSERLEQALKRPDLEIGPPPFKLAAAGRMNARGISVFYGATDRGVALAEVRPFVGSRVVTARFDFIRPLRLLDIEGLESVAVKGSLFDPAYGARLEKIEFLRSLSRRIAVPVMPDDEPFEYLPTQAIADYLATGTDPRLDGIIYPSVQGAKGMKNVVLFHKAALVQELDIPEGTEISAQLETPTEDGPEIDYWVWEETPKKKDANANEVEGMDLRFHLPPQAIEDTREPALKIVVDSIEVHHVTGISFETEDHSVKRHRFEKRDNKF